MLRANPWALALVVAAAALAAAATPAVLAAGAPPAAHAHDEAQGATLKLDHGRKWASDAPLRDGMARIRGLVAAKVGNAHEGTMGPAEYAALAGQVEVEVGKIVASCKLPPEADAVLHVVLSDLMAGTDAMAGRGKATAPRDGLVKVVAAVNDYGRTFEHPGWKPIR
jgi:hypothetical protein